MFCFDLFSLIMPINLLALKMTPYIDIYISQKILLILKFLTYHSLSLLLILFYFNRVFIQLWLGETVFLFSLLSYSLYYWWKKKDFVYNTQQNPFTYTPQILYLYTWAATFLLYTFH